jgi:hypothetical protein
MNGSYGVGEIEVMIFGVEKDTEASSTEVIGMIDDAVRIFSANLDTGYLVGPERGHTDYTKPAGFAYNGLEVSVRSKLRFNGLVALSDAELYVGALSERLVSLIVSYLADKTSGPESVLEEMWTTVDVVLNSSQKVLI